MDGILKVTNDIYNKFCTLVDKNWDEIAEIAKNHPISLCYKMRY